MISIKEAVRRKWKLPSEREWWYCKLAAVRRRKLLKLSEQQNHRCCYCTQRTWMFGRQQISSLLGYEEDRLPGMSKNTLATLEHIVPISSGGTEHESNLIMSCYRCNTSRGSQYSAIEFWEIRQDPQRYREHVMQKRRARTAKRQTPERKAKRQHKYDQTVMWFGYLAATSPHIADILTALTQFLNEKVAQMNTKNQIRIDRIMGA